MKVAPLASPTGTPGQSIGAIDTGRTASPVKLERARAIARGETVPAQTTEQPQQEKKPSLQSIKMKTQRSVYRDNGPQVEQVEEQVQEAPQVATSSTPESTEQGVVEATQPLSPQFAALAKQKRALQLERAQLEKQKAELANQTPKAGNDELINRLKTQPLSVLQEYGVTYDQLTEAVLADQGGINPEIQALKAEIKALKEGVDKSFVTQEQRAEESALTEMLYQAENLAKEGDSFEMIREQNAYEDVLRTIYTTYKNTGRVLDVQEAMKTVEDKLLADAEKTARIKKVQSRLMPAQSVQQPQKQIRTLTSQNMATPTMDRKARAIAAMMGTLKR